MFKFSNISEAVIPVQWNKCIVYQRSEGQHKTLVLRFYEADRLNRELTEAEKNHW
jgi:hypothetical protein